MLQLIKFKIFKDTYYILWRLDYGYLLDLLEVDNRGLDIIKTR